MPPLPLIQNPPAPSTQQDLQPNPPRQPMLWAALSYSAGIVTGVHAWRPASWWVAAAVAFLAAGLFFVSRRKWLGVSLALGAFFLAGALQIQLRGPTDALDPSLQPFDGELVVMTAHVTRDGKFREGAPNEIRQSLDVETEEIVAQNRQPIPVHSGVRLGIYSTRPGDVSQRPFHYGERLRLPVKLKLPHNFRNPGAFDYQGYLAANGISALGSAKAEDVATAPRLHRKPSRTLAHPPSLQHHRQSAHAVARAAGRINRRHGDRRRGLHRPRHPSRFPALRHLSHPRSLRHERDHPRLRCFLDPSPHAPRRDSRHPAHDSFSALPTLFSPK